MDNNDLAVREMTLEDVPLILDYWYNSSPEYLKSMGADIHKMPERSGFEKMLQHQLALPYYEKQGYVIVWLDQKLPCGHSHVNKIIYQEEAYMHLHLWDSPKRRKGLGVKFLKKTIPYYFENLQLENLFCEPYAFNPAPNKTLPKLGFEFLKQYKTTPGSINFEQEVRKYQMTKAIFHERY